MPLSAREGAELDPVLCEGVPECAEEALRGWILQTASLDQNEARHVLIRLGLTLPTSLPTTLCAGARRGWKGTGQAGHGVEAPAPGVESSAGTAGSNCVSPIPVLRPRGDLQPLPTDPYVRFLAEGTNAGILWDVVDDLVHAMCSEPLSSDTPIWAVAKRSVAKRTKQILDPLRRLLEESRSVYEIQPGQRGLQRQIDAALAASADRSAGNAVAAGRPRAGRHLARARNMVFGLHPDPSGAYVEMILAVEEVACPLFLPNDPAPTLDKVRAHLRDYGDTYEYVLQGRTRQVVPRA